MQLWRVTPVAVKEKETSAFRLYNYYASMRQLLVILSCANTTVITKSELINIFNLPSAIVQNWLFVVTDMKHVFI